MTVGTTRIRRLQPSISRSFFNFKVAEFICVQHAYTRDAKIKSRISKFWLGIEYKNTYNLNSLNEISKHKFSDSKGDRQLGQDSIWVRNKNLFIFKGAVLSQLINTDKNQDWNYQFIYCLVYLRPLGYMNLLKCQQHLYYQNFTSHRGFIYVDICRYW